MTNLSIKPSQIEIQLKPGSGYIQSYNIKNNSDQEVILNSSIDSWVPQGLDGEVGYLNSLPDLKLSLSNADLKLGQSFVLKPNQTKQLVLKLQIPENSAPGDHYLTLFINQDISSITSTNSSGLIRLGSHLLISVSDSELPVTKLTLNNFKVKNHFIDSFFSSVRFSGEFRNDSAYFDKINHTLIITKNNNEVKKVTLFPDNVLANHSRQFRCVEENQPAECQLQKPLWPGIYQASVGKETISFLVLPYSILIFFTLASLITKLLIDLRKSNKL